MTRLIRRFTGMIAAAIVCAQAFGSHAQTTSTARQPAPTEVNQAYPGLASGVLSCATLGDLPGDTILRSGDISISSSQLAGETAGIPESAKEEITKNQFFVLEQLATKELLLKLAKAGAGATKNATTSETESEIILGHLKSIASNVTVSDQEVAGFYEQNKDMCGGASLDQMKDQLKKYVLDQKQQETITQYINTLGQRVPITVSASWTKTQAALAMDNPVDKARQSARPSMVDFGASGCRPCDMMAPILTELEAKYKGKADILFVHVREQQILAARYAIQSIPVQVFFDKNGKEVFRHTGFFPQNEIEQKLAEMGVH